MKQTKAQNKEEYREAVINTDADMLVTGYAAVVDSPTVLFKDEAGTEYKEVFVQGCFDNTDFTDTVFRYNHNDSFELLARTSNNTLTIENDGKGLKITANIADTSQGKDIYTLIKREDITKMSIGFIVRSDYYDVQTHTRYITDVEKLVDVSAVDDPAYKDTYIVVMDQFKQAEEDDALRKKINILSEI